MSDIKNQQKSRSAEPTKDIKGMNINRKDSPSYSYLSDHNHSLKTDDQKLYSPKETSYKTALDQSQSHFSEKQKDYEIHDFVK